MSENENLLLRLRQGVDGYSRTQQKLGEFVLSDPTKVVYLTITELARESDTSEASVTRLCRALGCKGYNEFKMALALDLQQGQPVEHSGDEIDNVVNESVQALQDTAKLLDRTLLESAALALHQAQSVQIYGVAASAILGEYLHYKLLRLGKPAQLFSDMHRAAMNATTLNKDSLVVAISSSGSTRDLLHVVKLARKQGVRVLALSNTPRSPLASLSDIQLVAAKPEGPLSAGALNAKVGVMLLVELLTTSLIALDDQYSDVSQQTASATLPLLL
ncbi:MurR/RpiR family transcriptional regulator [Citrobacter portucalensis]|uniref:MurR/RpiR family transcriptional regulator n=1 Tax=Citrobacter portucalensis TaxID=1639133 RepID=UPI002244BBE5|nr:MurR/RpiR family transcriptional regulator [Citrobacter portucalensis]MCW8354160.1 MurR/RpiR family transcriptional regulator [Citrobacter portucalensis]MCX8995382.1 MurR/RpiR family transcriptional regulator [Citrobacter portucalensis]MCX9043341.1 MurR/RpiR family transcriptional regulator [Citrobacter portucalensis]MCX9052255.1 MurR/RpiR family transcriptional regulator [Citrobacter portucalensis]MCX9059223.1 MurR/RpiR family transcriptional regulator [Citrobacter portucalensis]